MAEGLFRAAVKDRSDIETASAGVSAAEGQPPSAPGVEACKALGIDISDIISAQIDEDAVEWATHIFTMTRGHFETIRLFFPEAEDKLHLMGEFIPNRRGGPDVPDPIGMGIGAYIECRDALRSAIPHLLKYLDQDKPMSTSASPAESTPSKSTSGAAGAGHSPSLAEVDPEIAAAIAAEKKRQFENIELIASENFTSRAVMEAQGSCLTNKYAEGYPGKRWYGGCEEVDKAEQLAIDRACQLFGAKFANVQPHSGSQANAAVYFSVLQPGDKVLGMNLAHGGHLTHGNPANFSGRFYQFCQYGVRQSDERIDYDELAEVAKREQPKMITAGASAYPRIIDFQKMSEIAKSVGAYLFVDMAHIAGLVAAGVHPSPMEHADFVTTTTHKSLRGPRGGMILTNSEELIKKINSQVFPGVQGGPLMHVIAAKAVCFLEALRPSFREYQQQVVQNAKALAGALAHHGYRIVSGGTDNHLMLIDLRPRGLNGKIASETLDHAGITVNKNGIPFDTEKITLGGGIRVGTPAVTTRGMKEDEMFQIADFIHRALSAKDDAAELAKIRDEVRGLTSRYPLPG